MRHLVTMKSIAFPALALLLASGCTPRHNYTPPHTLEGQACIARCQDALEQCAAGQEQPRGLETDKCIGEARDRPVVCPPGLECPPVSCRYVSDEGVCGESYRACYRDCGGLVDDR